jgi:hypothetical protein
MCWRYVPCLLLSGPFCWARSDYDQSGDNKKSLTPVSAACRCLHSKLIARMRKSEQPAVMALRLGVRDELVNLVPQARPTLAAADRGQDLDARRNEFRERQGLV